MNAIFKPSNIHHISALVVMVGAISEDLFCAESVGTVFYCVKFVFILSHDFNRSA